MKERNKHRCHMYYEQMDVCDLKYPDNFFDIAIDKSTQTITLVNPSKSTSRATLEKMVSLRHNSAAYRIWMPFKLYTEKMVDMGGF